MSDPPSNMPSHIEIGLGRLFLKFLGFGLVAFGGPAAQIALLKRELVEREGWMTPARFNRVLAVMQALPGPEAHELCVHMGMRARGRWGGLLAGLGFMAPGFLLMMGLAAAYQTLDLGHPVVIGALLGVQAAVIGLIARATGRIAAHALGDRCLWLVAGVAAGATLAGVAFWIVLPTCGLAYAAARSRRHGLAAIVVAFAVALGLATGVAALHDSLGIGQVPAGEVIAVEPASLALLFGAGLKAGLLTFGGAYTAIPFVRADVVPRGWVQDSQFLDGLALSSALPAPLIIFVTFVGYLAGGPWGALAMTAGVFLPAFGLPLMFHDRLDAVIDNPRLHALLEGVTAGVVGLIAVTAIQLAWGLVQPRLGAPVDLAVLAGIGVLAFVAVTRWTRPVVAPAILAIAAGIGALLVAAS